jgi:hypothetical protein
MITQSRDIQPVLRHLEAALEATCATLLALESASMGDGQGALDASAVRPQMRKAIACLREGMSELRALHEVETSIVAFGFVLADAESASARARRRNLGRT